MKCFQALVQSQTIEPLGKPAVWVSWLESPPQPNPGQFFLLQPRQSDSLPTVCLPIDIRPDSILLEQPPQRTFIPGELMEMWGPAGKPFNPPAECRHWLLLSLGCHPGRLLPLITKGLEKGAALALWTDGSIPNLPPAVEILPRASDGLSWADYIAVDLGGSETLDLRAFGLESLDEPGTRTVEVLITPPMPCGFGGCGLCAVKGKRGWQLACLEGAVFDWNDLRS